MCVHVCKCVLFGTCLSVLCSLCLRVFVCVVCLCLCLCLCGAARALAVPSPHNRGNRWRSSGTCVELVIFGFASKELLKNQSFSKPLRTSSTAAGHPPWSDFVGSLVQTWLSILEFQRTDKKLRDAISIHGFQGKDTKRDL